MEPPPVDDGGNSSPACRSDFDCDDGQFCNGMETCDPANGCESGPPPDCDDGVFCNGREQCDGNQCTPGSAPCAGMGCDEAGRTCIVDLPPVTLETVIVADDGQFLGVINDNSFDSDSIANRFGTYGSPFSSHSIWNDFGTYGSSFSVS
jgi:hypothetical protein